VVVRNYGNSPEAPLALFKLGEAYRELQDQEQATRVLCELTAKYPNTREAQLAAGQGLRCS